MFSVNVKADVREVERAMGRLRGGTGTAVARALNKGIRKGQSVAVKRLAAEVPAVKQRTIRHLSSLELANKRRWTAELSFLHWRFPIYRMGARVGHGGVTYKGKGGGRSIIKGAFIATMQSGHTGVFKRTGEFRQMKSGRYRGKVREAIRERFGPSLAVLFNKPHVKSMVERESLKTFRAELSRQFEVLRKRAGFGR